MLSAPRWSTALTPPLIEQATVEASEPNADPVCWRHPGGEHLEVMMTKKRGRPTIYSEKVATEICVRLAVGESLRSMCKEESMPSFPTVMRWLFEQYPPEDPRVQFRDQCARARDPGRDLCGSDGRDC